MRQRIHHQPEINQPDQPGAGFPIRHVTFKVRRAFGPVQRLTFYVLRSGRLVSGLILLLTLTACGSAATTATPAGLPSTATAAPGTTPLPGATAEAPPLPPAEMLQRAATVFSDLQSYYLSLDIRQGKLQVKGLEVKQAEGSLQAPDRYDVKVKVALLVVEFKVPVVGLDGQQYMKDDFGHWNPSKPDEKLDLPGLFDPQAGVGPTLAKLRSPRYLGTETLAGVSRLHLQGQLGGPDIARLTLGKLGSRDVTLGAWLDPATYRLTQLALQETGPQGAYWVYNFSKFNEPVNIQKPA
jgi:hypothetical protein